MFVVNFYLAGACAVLSNCTNDTNHGRFSIRVLVRARGLVKRHQSLPEHCSNSKHASSEYCRKTRKCCVLDPGPQDRRILPQSTSAQRPSLVLQLFKLAVDGGPSFHVAQK